MAEPRRPSISETFSEMAPMVHVQEQEERSCTPSTSTLAEFKKQVKLFLELAIPGTLLSLGGNVTPFLIASVVGLKFGETYLSAFTLANLTGNLFSYALMWGMFSAADTLGPQAFGKGNYEEVGLIALRGVFVTSVIALVVNAFLVLQLESFLVNVMGQPPEASRHAMEWYRIFVVALPFATIFNAGWKFLSAQHVMMPLIYVSVTSCAVVLPIALEILTNRYGYLGSAWAYVTFQATQCTLLLIYLKWKQPHVPQSWPGLGWESWKRALQWKPLMQFVSLGSGGMLAQSEWIYWEAIGLIIGKLGVVELSAHSIPYQVIMMGCMAPFSFGTALTIRMGVLLSQPKRDGYDSVRKTKYISIATIILSLALFGLMSVWMALYRDWIYSFFTTADAVLEMVESIWWKVCLFNFNVAIFAMFTGVAQGLGKQWTLGIVNFLVLWLFGIPVTYFTTVALGGGLEEAWTWINAPYVLMNISLFAIFLTTDWHKIQDQILAGEIVQDPEKEKITESSRGEESTSLLGGAGRQNYSGVVVDGQV